MEKSVNLKCQLHKLEIEYVCIEKHCQESKKVFCQQCVNLKNEHFQQHNSVLIEELLKDQVQQRRVAGLEKDCIRLAEVAQQESLKIDQQFGVLFKAFFQESEATKEKLKNKHVLVYQQILDKMAAVKQQNSQQQREREKEKGKGGGWFGAKKREELVLDTQQKVLQLVEQNRDKVELTTQLNELQSLLQKQQEPFKSNSKEVVAEFEYHLKTVMAMLLEHPQQQPMRNSRSSYHSINLLPEPEDEHSSNTSVQHLAFINENSDIQINNEKVIQTLMKVEKLPHINQHVLDKLNLQVIGPIYQDNFIFYGQYDIKRKQKIGRGKLVNRETGALYEGYFRDDQPFGVGRLIQANGDYYEGFTQHLRPEGKGLLVERQGQLVFQGEFKNGLKHGIGEEQRPNGVLIKGSFKNNVLDNNMTILIQYKDGSYYQGQHLNGQIDGEGQVIYKNGEKYYGRFQEGYKWGKGVYQFQAGHKYEGHFYKDYPHGEGIFYYNDGVIFKGEFKNGLQNGKGIEINKEKNIQKIGEWNNGSFVRWLN